MRLSGGRTATEAEGRVEVCTLVGRYSWRTVCGKQWTDNNTAVVCRYFGSSDVIGGRFISLYWNYSCHNNEINVICLRIYYCRQLDSDYFTSEMFGRGVGYIGMDYVNCTGSESQLRECIHFTHYYGCSHNDDVGVRCRPGKLVLLYTL